MRRRHPPTQLDPHPRGKALGEAEGANSTGGWLATQLATHTTGEGQQGEQHRSGGRITSDTWSSRGNTSHA
jgi:hypothetical protein